jgi:hypothetical protein
MRHSYLTHVSSSQHTLQNILTTNQHSYKMMHSIPIAQGYHRSL